MNKKVKLIKILSLFLLVTLIFCAGYFSNKFLFKKSNSIKDVDLKKEVKINENKYIAFLFEIYDLIQQNYWDKITDEQLTSLYILGAEKLTNNKIELQTKDKTNLEKTLLNVLNELKEENKKQEFTANLADIVLANLQPFGRSRLYSQKEETALKNNVENRNPEVDQYQVLGVEKNSTPEQINKVYENKTVELKKDTTPQGKEKLAQINKAYEILSDQKNKALYDQSGVEPTMENKLIRPDIFYLHLTKFSPTTIEELLSVTQKVDKNPGPDTLIFDLRDNLGGAIDGLPYFLGPFIGNDQYAYQFLHQGEKQDFKTKIGWLPTLVRFKKVIFLINQNVQSTAEVMAAVVKKYNVGIVVGTPTKGWGTVERVFPLSLQIDDKTKYSAFLVHSLTLREDGQPIEGKGVDPTVNINNPGWENQLYQYFRYDGLADIIKNIWKN